MTGIHFGERQKKIFRILMKMGMAKLNLEKQVAEENLEITSNKIIAALNTILLACVHQIKPKWQRECVKLYGQAMLWIIQKDTAYRDLFFWMLYQVLKRADKLLKLIEPYVKPPEEWYCNKHKDSVDKTHRLKKEDKISADSKSFEESIFTPSIQDKRHKKIKLK